MKTNCRHFQGDRPCSPHKNTGVHCEECSEYDPVKPEFASLINLDDVLITGDTLALHIGLALRKMIVAYFGPTAPWEVNLYGMGEKIIAPVDCIARYRTNCDKSSKYSELISIDDILNTVAYSIKT